MTMIAGTLDDGWVTVEPGEGDKPATRPNDPDLLRRQGAAPRGGRVSHPREEGQLARPRPRARARPRPPRTHHLRAAAPRRQEGGRRRRREGARPHRRGLVAGGRSGLRRGAPRAHRTGAGAGGGARLAGRRRGGRRRARRRAAQDAAARRRDPGARGRLPAGRRRRKGGHADRGGEGDPRRPAAGPLPPGARPPGRRGSRPTGSPSCGATARPIPTTRSPRASPRRRAPESRSRSFPRRRRATTPSRPRFSATEERAALASDAYDFTLSWPLSWRVDNLSSSPETGLLIDFATGRVLRDDGEAERAAAVVLVQRPAGNGAAGALAHKGARNIFPTAKLKSLPPLIPGSTPRAVPRARPGGQPPGRGDHRPAQRRRHLHRPERDRRQLPQAQGRVRGVREELRSGEGTGENSK